MSGFNFTVDHNLCLVSCSADLEARLGVPAHLLLGCLYSEWLPAICVSGADCLGEVIRSGKPRELSGYRFPSLNGVMTADVFIRPALAEGGAMGAQVEVCSLAPFTEGAVPVREKRWGELGKVVAMLSHGVRNPLNAIKGAITYLHGRYADEVELQEFAGIMAEEISRLEQFIGGFLTTAAQGGEPELIDVNALLRKVATFTSLQAQAAGVSIDFRCGDVLPVRVDGFQFEQAILNLVNNALAALADGGRIQLLSTMVIERGASFVAVEVADSGPGMDPARVALLHDPASEPELGKDRGFGLFITREMVTSHGGRLEIVSVDEHGTRVRLLLPADSRNATGQEIP